MFPPLQTNRSPLKRSAARGDGGRGGGLPQPTQFCTFFSSTSFQAKPVDCMRALWAHTANAHQYAHTARLKGDSDGSQPHACTRVTR